MNTETIFQFRISHDAYDIMRKVLRNPEVTGPEINGAFCRVTSSYDVSLSIQSDYQAQCKEDELLSVRLFNNNERQFVVLKSLMKQVEKGVEITS